MLSIRMISYAVGDFEILKEVTGYINASEVIGLVGSNGAGKSTLADVISGYLSPTSGSVFVEEEEVTGHTPDEVARRGVARMFQAPRLSWNMTALANVRVASLLETSARDAMAHDWLACHEAVRRVGLSAESHKLARDLSFGQQRLLALAQVLVRPAKVLLLDEPFSGLKAAMLPRVIEIIREEAKRGRAILVIDHMLSALRELGCRMWFLDGGGLTYFDTFDILNNSTRFRDSYLCRDEKGSTAVRTSSLTLFRNFKRREPLLEVKDADFGYGNQLVLRNSSFGVYPGEVLAFIGINGAGKSTLLRGIAGFSRLFKGSIRLGGESIDLLKIHDRMRRGLRFLPQTHRLFSQLSIRDNCRLALEGLSYSEGPPIFSRRVPDEAFYSCITPAAPDNPFSRRDASTLSGGEQAKVALALLDIGDSRVLLLDEPTAGLDRSSRAEVIDRVKSWKEAGKAVIIVEHDLAFVNAIAWRIFIVTPQRISELETWDTEYLLEAMLRLAKEGNNEVE